jgi:hypothetical protein
VDQKKEVIYVPYWIAGMLERNNLPLSTVLDYRKISQFLSAQEQGNMLLFQNFNPFIEKMSDGRRVPDCQSCCVVGDTNITESLQSYTLTSVWEKSVSNSSDANDNNLRRGLQNLSSLAWGQLAEAEVNMRFDPVNAGRVSHEHPFITYDVEREFLIVVVYPAFFESANYAANKFALCKDVLKVLYVYNSYASGCKTPYFRKYLEALA